jgi:L-ascorbate metabolism protein UlaG (beta-lactamase superfamily)
MDAAAVVAARGLKYLFAAIIGDASDRKFRFLITNLRVYSTQLFLIGLVPLSLCLSVALVAAQPISGVEPANVILKWLGNAGWEIRYGKTVILIDPFLTRKDRVMDAEWKTDEAAVLKVITGADYIFAGHSHHDHIGDIPFIAKRFDAKVIGSRTTTNLMLTAGLKQSQLVTIGGGENLIEKDFSVRVMESQHGVLRRNGRRSQPKSEELLEPKSAPLLGRDFVEGKSFLYHFTFGKHRILNQSTGNFLVENLAGLQPDTILMAPVQGYDLASVLKTLNPQTIIHHHFDEWRAPFVEGIRESNTRRAERFVREVKSVNEKIKVIVPSFLTAYTLD